MEDNNVEVAVIKEQYAEILRRLTRIDNTLIVQNGRIGKLEEWRWKASGAVLVIGMIIAYVLK